MIKKNIKLDRTTKFLYDTISLTLNESLNISKTFDNLKILLGDLIVEKIFPLLI